MSEWADFEILDDDDDLYSTDTDIQFASENDDQGADLTIQSTVYASILVSCFLSLVCVGNPQYDSHLQK